MGFLKVAKTGWGIWYFYIGKAVAAFTQEIPAQNTQQHLKRHDILQRYFSDRTVFIEFNILNFTALLHYLS